MWLPKTLGTKKKIHDLSSSGQISISVNELYADDVCISNGIELTNWSDECVQLVVCERCAIVQCAPGNWGTFRKAGEYIILMPLFDLLQDNWEDDEIAPPNFMKHYGALLFTCERYDELSQLVPAAPNLEIIKELNLNEAVWLMQWEAPDHVLGKIPQQIEFQKDKLLATTHDSDDVATDNLMRLLNNASHSTETVVLESISDEKTMVSFFFDGVQYMEWQPLCLFEDSWQLVLKPGYRINGKTDGHS